LLRIIGLARVSGEEQALDSNALIQQVHRLLENGAQKVIADVASRMDNDRSGLNHLFSLVEKREVDVVLITRLDRLTASPTLFEYITNLFRKYKVSLVALDEKIDFETAQGQVIGDIQIALNKGEIIRLRERVKRGVEYRRKMKRPNFPPFGYCIENNQYKLDTKPFLCLIECQPIDKSQVINGMSKADMARDFIEIFRKARSLFNAVRQINQKYGIQKTNYKPPVAEQFYVFEASDGTPSKKTLSKKPSRAAGNIRFNSSALGGWLRNPVLWGATRYNTRIGDARTNPNEWIICYNTHLDQALMSLQQAKEIEEIIAYNAVHRGWGTKSTASSYPLSGLLQCACCRAFMKLVPRTRKNSPKRLYYQCSFYKEAACTNRRMIKAVDVEEKLIQTLVSKAEAIAQLALLQDSPPEPELTKLNEQLRSLEAIDNPAVTGAINSVRNQIEKRQQQLAQEQSRFHANYKMLVEVFSDELYFKSLPPEEQRQVFHGLVDKVLVKDGAIVEVRLKV
jgi:DNA invertase Pin-like site-specific DNA recombinase